MPFYVRLGPRGLIFRLGTFWIGLVGSAVYRRASRRRSRPTPHPRSAPAGLARFGFVGDNSSNTSPLDDRSDPT